MGIHIMKLTQDQLQQIKDTKEQVFATSRFIKAFKDFDNSDLASYDSLVSNNEVNGVVPEPLQKLLVSPTFEKDSDKQIIFNSLHDGINEYKRKNGGALPSAEVVYSALLMAQEIDPNTRQSQELYDSLSHGHHESLGIVPTSVNVVISHAISNAIPLVAMLPNPKGSNEVPLVHTQVITGNSVGGMRKGDIINGINAGMPFVENVHMLTMNDDGGGAFSLTVRHGYKQEKRANKTLKFVVDDKFKEAPFVAGRVAIFVKGHEVANDRLVSHQTTKGVNALQSLGEVQIGTDKYKVTQGTADLDKHKISVTFDSSLTTPAQDDVEARIVFDYERKDENNKKILTEPATDIEVRPYSIYADPVRGLSSATIDAITQLQNELNISWYASVQYVFINKYNIEQNARLLRQAVSVCKFDQERTVTFDATKAGITFATMRDMFRTIKVTFGKARTKLSQLINVSIGNYDLYVSDKGAEFFEGMDSNDYISTGIAFGDQSSIYQIGSLPNGARVFYVPANMQVFNEEELTNGAEMLLIPQYYENAKAPFVGTIAVPFMPRKSNKDAFEEDGGVYARIGAEVNPIPKYKNQFILIELMNLPAL